MKKIMILVLIFTVNVLFADDLLNDVVYNGNISLLDNMIRPQQLMNFNQNELRILRNMIYAKYNYRFNSNDLSEYFSQFPWYNNTQDTVENNLTYIDHKNIKLIQDLEAIFPLFIPYTDERIYDLALTYRDEQVVILGWSVDCIFFYYLWDLRIYDLKQNKILSHGRENYAIYFNGVGRKEMIDEVISVAANQYNILPMVNNVHANIEGYSIYAKDIRLNESYRYCLEIGLVNDIDNNITRNIKNIYYWQYKPLTENDLLYICIQNPFDENTVALFVFYTYVGSGNYDGFYITNDILGIDKNEL